MAPPADLAAQVAAALSEDIGSGDVTAALIPASQQVLARVLCREAAVVCGLPWVEETFRQLDRNVQVQALVAEGGHVVPNQPLFTAQGPARAILSGERTALNFLQLLSATATQTAGYVAAVSGTGCRILDTRKTLPGLRTAQKYAVRVGGGVNFRIGLYDQVLIKENHIAACGSITAAVQRARELSPQLKVEVETENLQELGEALAARADIIMLDEFSLEDMRAAVQLNREHAHRAVLECSGGVNLENVRKLAETGVDCISIGGITKHVRAVDLSMRVSVV
ncbi:MAG TPA: carboxylating nicotinate-nucleotide diphosphorylase [Steroidobacteraceae bacterium]|nr:carboxylating nicotinate-nucleotide diphosphorylase [Steroidobacteraceae bacterium]